MACSYFFQLLIQGVLTFTLSIALLLASIFLFPTIWKGRMANPGKKVLSKLFLILCIIASISGAVGVQISKLLCKLFEH